MDFDKIAEEKIREAMERGEFDDLPGSGKPLQGLDSYFATPEDILSSAKKHSIQADSSNPLARSASGRSRNRRTAVSSLPSLSLFGGGESSKPTLSPLRSISLCKAIRAKSVISSEFPAKSSN